MLQEPGAIQAVIAAAPDVVEIAVPGGDKELPLDRGAVKPDVTPPALRHGGDAAAASVHPAAAFFAAWKGGTDTPLKPEPPLTLLYSFLGAFISILIIACIDQYASPKEGFDVPYLVASFGASAVLVFGLPQAKLSQPRNLVGGQCLSALTGILVRLILQPRWASKASFVSAALGMALSLTVMQATGTTHPPAGATGLLAGRMDPIGDWWGFKFLLTVFLDAVTMLLVALIFNNLVPKRRYPSFW